MSVFGKPEDDTISEHTHILIDRETEPHRYLKTVNLAMKIEQAQEIVDFLQARIARQRPDTAPLTVLCLSTGTPHPSRWREDLQAYEASPVLGFSEGE
jgi:hypothetical protein